jgi:hypothetical protein
MKPFKSGLVIASWLLRITLVWFVYQQYFAPFTEFNVKTLEFYIQAMYVVFALLLVIGGLVKKPVVTVISGLFIFVLPVVQLIRSFPGEFQKHMLIYLIPLAIGFHFFASGNN